MTNSDRTDVIVIGAGIAGASVAAELSDAGQSVLLLERESQPGYHTTGRSAALYTKAYGPEVVRGLTRASYQFYQGEEPGEPPTDLLRPRGALFIARPDQAEALAALQAELGDAVKPVAGSDLHDRVTILRPGYANAGLIDASAADIDVHGLHLHYLKRLKAAGGRVMTGAEVIGLTRDGDWQVQTGKAVLRAPVVVNAAGAWADMIAEMAGVAPLGLRPLRRTALLVAPPDGVVPDAWPLVVDVEEQFYLKPDAGKLLLSPADETLSPPCDAQPEELDVAICIDRVEKAFDLQVRRIDHKWAGLRSFLPDGDPVAGFEPDAPGFFWLAGQGGYGIQTAPALARAAAALATGRSLPDDIAAEGVDAATLSPSRRRITA